MSAEPKSVKRKIISGRSETLIEHDSRVGARAVWPANHDFQPDRLPVFAQARGDQLRGEFLRAGGMRENEREKEKSGSAQAGADSIGAPGFPALHAFALLPSPSPLTVRRVAFHHSGQPGPESCPRRR